MDKPFWTPKNIALVLLPTLLLTLLVISFARRDYAEPLFIHATYYFFVVMMCCWVSVYAYAARGLRWPSIMAWAKDNWPGLVVAALATLVAALAVQPALRVLADEANLVGTSKNFFTIKAATFTTTGKYYYDNFWDSGVVIDRRPAIYPFLVSLLHIVRGYTYKNAFLFNLLIVPIFVLVAYRLAKSLAGEVFGVVAAIFVVAHPITLISARSGGFDFFAAFFALLVIKNFLDHCREPSAERLAVLWMNLCVFAEIRYETGLFIAPVVGLLLVFRLVKLDYLRPYAVIYSLSPGFLLPRIWQSILRGNVPEQEAGAITFSFGNFITNLRDYFKPILSPFDFHPPHSSVILALGVVGTLLWLRWVDRRLLSANWRSAEFKFSVLVIAWMVMQLGIVFTYVWGRSGHPAAARLVISLDTFFAFPAAYILAILLKRFRPAIPLAVAAAIFCVYLPIASEYRILNELTLTREAATTWRFLESRHEKRILVISERPGLYTIMEYGALDFESARQDPAVLGAYDAHLFYDLYLIQNIDLATHKPIEAHDIWPERPRTPVLEFQNDANRTIRISRLAR